MDIITLFCEIHDFFLAYEQYQAQHQLPEISEHAIHAADPGAFIRAKS